MKVIPEKRIELSQTIASLTNMIRMEPGCLRCDCCQGIDDENCLFFLQEWDTWENLMIHLNSKNYRILRGARGLLKEPFERTLYTVVKGKFEKTFGKLSDNPRSGAVTTINN